MRAASRNAKFCVYKICLLFRLDLSGTLWGILIYYACKQKGDKQMVFVVKKCVGGRADFRLEMN